LEAFEKAEARIQKENPTLLYSDVLALAHASLSMEFGVEIIEGEDFAFALSIRGWTPFPDTVHALAKLSKHYKLIVLSNVDRQSFAHTQAKLEHGFKFDKIITAEEVGSYKPSLRNFEYMLSAVRKEYGIDKSKVLVMANSLFHDHAPANKLHLSSVWIERSGSGLIGGKSDAKWTWKFDTLGEMADAVETELKAWQWMAFLPAAIFAASALFLKYRQG
jgi:2-haloacid dehalogenase